MEKVWIEIWLMLDFTAFEGDTSWAQAETTHKCSGLPSLLWQLRSFQWMCGAKIHTFCTKLAIVCVKTGYDHIIERILGLLDGPGLQVRQNLIWWSKDCFICHLKSRFHRFFCWSFSKLVWFSIQCINVSFRVSDIPAQIGGNLWTGQQKKPPGQHWKNRI